MEEEERKSLPEKVLTPRFWAAAAAWMLPDGEHEVGDFRVVKDKKMLVVRPPLRKPDDRTQAAYTQIVVYPRPEHINAFAKAARGVLAGGPAEVNPGSVGTVNIAYHPSPLPYIGLAFAQSHYTTTHEEVPPLFASLHPEGRGEALPRSLATRYRGWRVRALREALNIAQAEGVPFIVHKGATGGFSREKRERVDNQFFDDFRRAYEGLNLKAEETPTHFIVYPKKTERRKA